MKEEEIHAELASIRNLMERSSKFISLSGLSGVMAGIYALTGSYIGYSIVRGKYGVTPMTGTYADDPGTYHRLIIIALSILFLSIATCIMLSIRQARKTGETYWNPVSRRMLISMSLPLATGGAFILILLLRGQPDLIAASCLIFYGLSLIAASEYTYTDIRWLGICEVLLGLFAALFPSAGFICWLTGFGILHIIYGTVMHFKYDR